MTTETTAKERPILFSGEMIRAILDGRKIQTRRVVKPQPTVTDTGCPRWGTYDGPKMYMVPRRAGGGNEVTMTDLIAEHCPYGQPGSRLWVRETWALVPRTAYRGSEGVQQILRPDDDHDAAVYRAGWNRSEPGRWRPSIHMPRWASRLTLEITGIRVERVQDISEADAENEGLTIWEDTYFTIPGTDVLSRNPITVFEALWNGINEARGYGWAANPWVWVLEFRRVS